MTATTCSFQDIVLD